MADDNPNMEGEGTGSIEERLEPTVKPDGPIKRMKNRVVSGVRTTGRWTKRAIITGVTLGVLGTLGYTGTYSVPETQNALVLRLGKPVREITLDKGDFCNSNGPGLHCKIPFFETVVYMTNQVDVFDEDPVLMQTIKNEPTKIDSFGLFSNNSPFKFMETVQAIPEVAQARLNTRFTPKVRAEVGGRTIRELVSNTKPLDYEGEYVGREKAMRNIHEDLKPVFSKMGFDLRYFGIKRVELPEESEYAVLKSMESERLAEVARIRSEGDKEAKRIAGEKEKKVVIIGANANYEGRRIVADAQKYAKSLRFEEYGKDPRLFCYYVVPRRLAAGFGDNTNAYLGLDQIMGLFDNMGCKLNLPNIPYKPN